MAPRTDDCIDRQPSHFPAQRQCMHPCHILQVGQCRIPAERPEKRPPEYVGDRQRGSTVPQHVRNEVGIAGHAAVELVAVGILKPNASTAYIGATSADRAVLQPATRGFEVIVVVQEADVFTARSFQPRIARDIGLRFRDMQHADTGKFGEITDTHRNIPIGDDKNLVLGFLQACNRAFHGTPQESWPVAPGGNDYRNFGRGVKIHGAG
jgi:hypothetical protein